MDNYVQTPIIERLVKRFRLSDHPNQAGLWTLSPRIVPVTNVDDLLKTLNFPAFVTYNVTATGLITLDTVPVGKRRKYHAISAGLATGTFTVNAFALANGSASFYAKTFTPASGITYTPGNGDNPILLDAGWLIQVNVDSKAVNGTLNYTALYEEEDAY